MNARSSSPIRILYDPKRIPDRLDPFSMITDFADSNLPVLVSGGPGTGKKCLAEYAHHSAHRKGPFLVADIQGLDAGAQSTLLFGKAGQAGLLEQAVGGTLYIDEVASLAPEVQQRLSEWISHGRPTTDPAKNPRIIAGTRSSVGDLMSSTTLRTSFLFNLARVHLRMPPAHYMRETTLRLIASQWSKEVLDTTPTFSPDYWSSLEQIRSEGNLHELKGLIQRSCLIAQKRRGKGRAAPKIEDQDLEEALTSGLGVSDEYRLLGVIDSLLRDNPGIKQSDLAAYLPDAMTSTDVARLFIDRSKPSVNGIIPRTRLGIYLDLWKNEFPTLNSWIDAQSREPRKTRKRTKGSAPDALESAASAS